MKRRYVGTAIRVAVFAILLLPHLAVADSPSDDDDWDSDGPVDKTPHVSGLAAFSGRATLFSNGSLPESDKLSDEYTFQVEHTHVKFSGDLSNHLSWEIMPCLTHMNDFSVLTAKVTYRFHPAFAVTAGRFLLPFGQFNERSLPGQYAPVSRPLLYSSHEDRAIAVAGATPANFLFTPRDDEGILVTGNAWLGADDQVQLSWSAYVTNGLRSVSNQMARFWDDNNNAKQYGARFSVAYNGDPLELAVSGSILSNKYEEELNQLAWSADLSLGVQYQTGRRITLRGEFTNMTREVQPNKELIEGDEGVRGAYVSLDADVLDWLGVFYEWDWLQNRTPRAQLDEGFRDLELITQRHTAGLRFTVDGSLLIKAEYGLWLEPMGVPTAHRVSVQTVVTF